MYFYRQSIILFGAVLPLLLAAAMIGIGSLVSSKVKTSFDGKAVHFKTYEQNRLAALEIESKIERERKHLSRWESILAKETSSTVTANLREISEKLPSKDSKEFQQTAFERPAGKSGFGTASAQTSTPIRMSFRGTYRTLQRTFLELETRMPQLQLYELRLDANNTQSSVINMQVAYTAWEK